MRSLLQSLVFLDMRPEEALRLYAMIVFSVGAHILAALALFLLPVTLSLPEPSPVAIEVVDVLPEPEPEIVQPEPEVVQPEPEVVQPEPEIIERPRPTPRPDPRPAPAEPAPPEAEPAADPAPAEEAIADFSGMTLTNESADSAWETATGSGAPMEGPIGRPGAQVTGRNRSGSTQGTVGGTGQEERGPPIVARGNLSRQPGPPGDRLRTLLQSNYPREARQLGVEGHADVRVQVDADGSVRVLRISSETYEGFGDACRRTIRQGGRWDPPLDRQGNRVATITAFRCTFAVRF